MSYLTKIHYVKKFFMYHPTQLRFRIELFCVKNLLACNIDFTFARIVFD